MDNHDGIKLGRRKALALFGAGLSAFTGMLALDAATNAANAADACKTKVPLDDTALGLRRSLQYKEKATRVGKPCSTCSQFEPGKYGDCGGCKLFGGAITPDGSCLSYAPIKPA
jgi:hypothetical protein